ncbi:MAG TPA: ABC transporter permease [Pedobacter sp.]
MIKNFFKIAYRNLLRSKGFSAINIIGLAVGMAAAILLLLWIQNEVSYDNFHEKKDRIYQVWNLRPNGGEIKTSDNVSEPTAPAIAKDIPEVERVVRTDQGNENMLSVGDKKIIKQGLAADTGFLQIFTFPMLKGNPASALNGSNSIVLTEKTAKSLFGDEEPMGKIIKVDNKENFTVTGVLKDLPNNSSIDFEYLLLYDVVIRNRTATDYGWGDNSTPTFVLLKSNTSLASVAPKIRVLKQNYDRDAKKTNWELFLYPMDRWRLYSSFTNGVEDDGGRSGIVKLFLIIAGFILLIACINFMNLSTARSEKRAKEVGIRKVSGARKGSLIAQFIIESVLVAFVSGVIAIILVQLSLPAYNNLLEQELFINYADINTWLAILAFILFTGLIAGSYPAFFLSSFRPVSVLKGSFKRSNAAISPRKALVVVQFTFTIVLIICTIIVKQQIDYARERKAGYNMNNLAYHFMTGDIPKNYELIKNELIANGIATSVTKTNSPLTATWSNGGGQSWKGRDLEYRTSFDRYLQDEGLGTTAGLQFVQGRDLDLKKYPTDSTGLIINESALEVMKFKDPIGQQVSDLGVDWHIVGVVRDFILTNPYEPTRPILICGAKSSFMQFYTVLMKLNANNSTSQNLEKMAVIFKKYNPEYPFEYKFVDEEYAKKFENEKRQEILASLFAGLAILISCLGLFGLAAFMAESRIKEIGVRKVLGASVAGITVLLSKDFVKLVVISFIIAAPVAYWAMSKWLMTYTYRVDISLWVFVFAGILSIAIALSTVSYQSIKAALTNPVKNLRTE